MARPKKAVIEHTTSNVTDETRTEFWRKALQAKQEHEKALELAKSAGGIYRSVLKAAKKAGVDHEAIAHVLSMRFADPDLILAKQRETVRMLAISGVMPRIQTDLFAALGLEPSLSEEEMAKVEVERAYENGTKAGSEGENRTVNGFPPGSELFDAFDRGWIAGQEGLVKGIFGAGDAKAEDPEPAETKAQRDARVKREKRAAKTAEIAVENDAREPDAGFGDPEPVGDRWY